jgi:hypothetical protein
MKDFSIKKSKAAVNETILLSSVGLFGSEIQNPKTHLNHDYLI